MIPAQIVPAIYRTDKLDRVRQFIKAGFSARRIAAILHVPEQQVAWIKRNGDW